jgi:epoxyqueuosine reductase
MTQPNTLTTGIQFLAQGGLNLFASLDLAALPEPIRQMMAQSGVPLGDYRRLVLLGHGGRRMWEALQAGGWRTADPVDHYSASLTCQFIADYLGDPPTFWLYPETDYLIPLGQLGELAGWSHPSPLGLGISPIYGVWFAYRAAFLTSLDLPIITDSPQPSPCATCPDKPCIRACPAGAVQPEGFDVTGCSQYRLTASSPCADRCLARLACPFFPEHRYTLSQVQYHYGQSLKTLQTWYDG